MISHRAGTASTLAVVLLLLSIAVPALAQVTPLGATPPAPAGVLSSFAYDRQNHVYLHVWEYNWGVWGRFVQADGTAGGSFVVATNKLSFAGRPRVAAGAGTFMVTYVTDVNVEGGSNIFGQRIQYTGTGPTGGSLVGLPIPISPFSNDGSRFEVTADVAFNPVAQQFLVAYDEYFGGDREAMVRPFAPDGTALAAPVDISNGPGWQGATVLAYDWQANKYLAVFMGEDPMVPGGLAIGARLIDGTTLALSNQITVMTGFTIEPAVAYLPEANGFLVSWTGFNASRDVMARFVPTAFTGTLPAPAFAAMATPLHEGAAVLDYDFVSRKVLMGAMSDTMLIVGSVLDANGGSPSAQFPLSTITTTPSGGPLQLGSFYPTVRPAENGVFGTSYITEYAWAYLERFQLPPAGTPGPSCCVGGPPPPPTFTVTPTTWNPIGTGGTQLVTITASNPSATWTAVSNAAWLTVSTSGGTGSGSVTLTAASNAGSTVARSTTATIAGWTVSVTQAAGGTLGITPLGVAPPAPAGVLSSVAYDRQNHVYLHVWEYSWGVWGRFVQADGTAGGSFVVATNKLSFAGRPKVAAGAGTFLVTYVTDVNVEGGSNIFGQRVQYTGTGPTGGNLVGQPIPISPFSNDGSRFEVTADVAFNPVAQQFLVAYDEYFGGDREAMVRPFAPDGTALAAPVDISNGPGWQGATVLAYDWQANKYLAVFMGEDPMVPGGLAIGARLVDGTTLALSNQITVMTGFTIEPAVAYLPEANGFLVSWTAFNASRDVMARFVPTAFTGTLPAPAFAAMATPLHEGAAVLDYDFVSRKVLMGAMSDTMRIVGGVLDADGGSPSQQFLLSTIATTPSGGPLQLGSFYPTVRPAEGGIFGLSYITEYAWAYLERFQMTAASTPGPSCCAPPPTFAVTPTTWNAPKAGGAQVVTVTASSQSAPWTATSASSWLVLSATNGTGNGSVTLTAVPNGTAAPRTATVTIAGHSVLVTQADGASIAVPAGPPLMYLNGDSEQDTFAYNGTNGMWADLLTQPGGGFVQTLSGVWQPSLSIIPAEFNGDLLTDLFVSQSSTGQWFKLLNTGSGFTTQASGVWWPGWQKFVMDLDGDGRSDLFLYDPISGLWFRCLSTPSGFTYSQGIWNPDWELTPLNLNGDAFGDLFLINRTTGRWFWVLGGAGGFTYPVGGFWSPDWQIYAGDFDGDQRSDLLLHRPGNGQYFIAINNGAGFTYAQGAWATGWTPWVLDLNGDGASDLFLYNPASGKWLELLGNGLGQFSQIGSGTWAPGWQIHPTDFNHDGWADLLLYNPTTGLWIQAWNFTPGSFSYFQGQWSPGLTILAGSPGR